MNELTDSGSKYLNLFADGPVEWYMYSEAAFSEAYSTNKLMHISIGRFLSPRRPLEERFYSEPEVAKLLNELFINVKIDADEEVVVDWLFTSIFTASDEVQYGTMYDRYPMSFFIDLDTDKVTQPFWHFDYDIYEVGLNDFASSWQKTLMTHLAAPQLEESDLCSKLYQLTLRRSEFGFEPQLMPMFPEYLMRVKNMHDFHIEADANDVMPMRHFLSTGFGNLMQLWFLSHDKSREDRKGLEISLVRLTQWVRSVSFDHVGGGFYSPASNEDPMGAEIQKLLEFNAWSLNVLCQAASVSNDELLTRAACETADFIVDRLQHPQGGFYTGLFDKESSLDQAWRPRTLKRLLTEDEYLVVETLYGLDKRANWHGRWLLRRMSSWRSVVDQLFFSKEECEQLLESALSKMRQREHDSPTLVIDDRRLIVPNAMTVSALLFASRILGETRWISPALKGLGWLNWEFVENEESEFLIPGLLEGTHLLNALLDGLEYEWNDDLARNVRIIAGEANTELVDEETVINRTYVDLEPLLIKLPLRSEPGKVHPVNIVRRSLQRFGSLFNHRDSLQNLFNMFSDIEMFAAELKYVDHPASMFGLDFARNEIVVVLRGPEDECARWRNEIIKEYKPWLHVYVVPFENSKHAPDFLPKFMSVDERNQVTAYVRADCTEKGSCTTLEETLKLIDEL